MKESMKKNKVLLICTIIFSVISSISVVMLSLFIQSIIDCVTEGDLERFKQVLIYTIAYSMLMGGFYYIYGILSKTFIINVTWGLRNRIFSGIFKQNFKDFNSTNTADHISALTNDTKLIEENYLIPLLSVIQYSVMFIATIAILLYLSPIVTLGLFISMFVMFIVPNIFGKALENKQIRLSNQLSSFTSKIKDMLSGYDVIRVFNIKEDTKNEFENENTKLATSKFKVDKLIVVNETLSQLLGMGVQFVSIFLSSYLVIKGNLTMGMLIAIIQLSSTFIQPVIMIMSNIPKILSIKSVLNKLEKLENYKNNDFIGNEIATFESKIEVNNLSFAYEDNNIAINDIDLKIYKNKKYAIVGESGCGKSTLVKLLLGYYSNYDGKIKFDNNDIRILNVESLNEMFSIIHQNVYMFDKSIKDNICLYKDFSFERINNILEVSGIDKFIHELDEGIDYMVGENGSNLSGGQKQRIAIGRGLIQNTPILVLDEGTSSIDMQTGYDIESRLLKIKDLTLITITHNMSEELLSLYDEIIFMKDGRIVDKGSLEELLEKRGRFLDFYSLEKSYN